MENQITINLNGEAYALEKDKVHVFKVIEEQCSRESLKEVHRHLAEKGVEVVFVLVENYEDMKLTLEEITDKMRYR